MSLETIEQYLETLRHIDALWDASKESGEKAQINAIAKLAEDYESRQSLAGLTLVSAPVVDPHGPRIPLELFDELGEPVVLCGFIGWRSAMAAIRACNLLMVGDVRETIFWMNRKLLWSEYTPLQLAEQSDTGLQMVIEHIYRIEAGVFY